MDENTRKAMFLAKRPADLKPIAEDDEVGQARLACGQLAASRLTPENVDCFRELLLADVATHGKHPVLLEWLRPLAAGFETLRAALTDSSVFGRYLRSMAPLRAFISEDERVTILRSTHESIHPSVPICKKR